MAQRQGRRSLGLAPLPGLPTKADNGLTDAQRFEDFRRRHSKQNKDIIIDNVSRKTIIKGLQDDIAALHTELLEVRQANLILQAKIKRVQKDANKNIFGGNGTQVYEALNQLILAFPALKQLRDNLRIAREDEEEEDCAKKKKNRVNLVNGLVENTYATRPAEVARQNHGLWSLVEASESDGEQDNRRLKVKVKARHTGVGSIATSRSPRRSTQSPKVTYVEIASPSSSRSSVSPSPKKQSSVKKQRRRRESGLISIPPRSPSPQTQTQTQLQQTITPSEEVGEQSEWEEGKALEISPSDTNLNEDIPMPQDTVPSIPIVMVQREVELMDTIKEVSSSDSKLAVHTTSRHLGTVGEEGIGRGRRSRSSVNYKEPSLSKKMRKPDGISTDEVLLTAKPTSRRSLLPNTNLPAPPSSASTLRPSTPPKKPSSSASSSEWPLSPIPSEQPLLNKQQPTLPRPNGMRRKSTLPKAGNTARSMVEENNDEDDVDELVDLDLGHEGYEDDLGDVQSRTEKLMLNSPAKPKEPKVSSTKNKDDNTTSSISTDNNLPKRVSSLTGKSFKPSSTSIKSASGLGIRRPIMPSSVSSSGTTTTAGQRNFTPTGRILSGSSRRVESDVLMEGDQVNIPPIAATSTRKVSGDRDRERKVGGGISTSGTAARRRMSAAV
uniref:Shugoshin C-terminal domain-containing protein n=1 Tax=Kwoniella bestiolae CBS 10118 TaxID=1296100 RepID=A0A1B9GCX6_9TREE|nr:hypothetical protein I302_00365 [Kwoniella bestiolae CBS 10118]OCF28875.1 hypothetical protein I302_00365 [Kwoniella bestiolae CBS 10118]